MKPFIGFTLIELMIVLLILSVLILGALPAWQSSSEDTHLSVVENELIQALHYARNSALLSGKTLTLNPDPITHEWSDGLVLFQDNATHQFHRGDKIEYQWHWKYPEVHVQWHGFRSNDFLIFASDYNHASLSGHFALMVNGKEKKVVINRLGRVREASG